MAKLTLDTLFGALHDRRDADLAALRLVTDTNRQQAAIQGRLPGPGLAVAGARAERYLVD